MVTVSVEVNTVAGGPSARRVKVTAPSVARAVRLVGGADPATEVRLVFPANPEGFFGDAAAKDEVPARAVAA